LKLETHPGGTQTVTLTKRQPYLSRYEAGAGVTVTANRKNCKNSTSESKER